MMERLKKILLFLFILSFINEGMLSQAFAQDSKLSKQLDEISQLADKNEAFVKLSLLLNSSGLSSADQGDILLQQGRVLFTLDRYKEAASSTLQANNIAKKTGLLDVEARGNKLLGIIYYYQGELMLALKAYQKSLLYYDSNINSDKKMFALKRANLLNNIALVYTSLGQPDLSLKNYQLAEALYADYGDEIDKIDVRYNIAALHISLRRYDSAIEMLTVIIQKRLQLKDDYGVASAKADLGIAYKHSGQLELAKKNILAALHYFQKHGHKHDIASQLHNMSEFHNDMFEVEQAIFYGKKALIISEEVGHQKAYAGSLQSLASFFLFG